MIDEQQYTVETPEQIDLSYQVAGIGSRFLAALIDHVLLALIFSLGCTLLSTVASQLQAGVDPLLLAFLTGIGIYLFLCAYHIFFETTWNGQTPGKRMVGIRVVRAGGRPIGFLGSAIRNFIRLADFLPVLYGVGMITMFVDRRARRLGDLAAGSLAIKEGRRVTLDMLERPQAEEPPIVPAADRLTIPNLEALQPADIDLVRKYIRRRSSLAIETQRRIAQLLMQGLQARLGYEVRGDPEAFLLRLAAEYQLLQTKLETPPPPLAAQ